MKRKKRDKKILDSEMRSLLGEVTARPVEYMQDSWLVNGSTTISGETYCGYILKSKLYESQS